MLLVAPNELYQGAIGFPYVDFAPVMLVQLLPKLFLGFLFSFFRYKLVDSVNIFLNV